MKKGYPGQVLRRQNRGWGWYRNIGGGGLVKKINPGVGCGVVEVKI